jgi:hypothetical protein
VLNRAAFCRCGRAHAATMTGNVPVRYGPEQVQSFFAADRSPTLREIETSGGTRVRSST